MQRRSERIRGGRGSGRKPGATAVGKDAPDTPVAVSPTGGTPAVPSEKDGKPTLPPLPPSPSTPGRRPDPGQVLTPSVAPRDSKQSRVGRSPASHLAQKAGENLRKTPAAVKAVEEARTGGEAQPETTEEATSKEVEEARTGDEVQRTDADSKGDDEDAEGQESKIDGLGRRDESSDEGSDGDDMCRP